MREHMGLYRGKRIDNGEWVEGYYATNPEWDRKTYGEHYWIISCKNGIKYEVDPDTVGECTGLRDKNGKLIFEGDIVKTHYANTRKNDFVEQVVFHNGRFCSMFKFPEHGKMWANLPDGVPHFPQDKTPYMEWCEIIGTVHDNPELLKGGEG